MIQHDTCLISGTIESRRMVWHNQQQMSLSKAARAYELLDQIAAKGKIVLIVNKEENRR